MSVVYNVTRNDFFYGDMLRWINYSMHSKVIWNYNIDWKDLRAVLCHTLELEE
jgi:hypothetical protein